MSSNTTTGKLAYVVLDGHAAVKLRVYEAVGEFSAAARKLVEQVFGLLSGQGGLVVGRDEERVGADGAFQRIEHPYRLLRQREHARGGNVYALRTEVHEEVYQDDDGEERDRHDGDVGAVASLSARHEDGDGARR